MKIGETFKYTDLDNVIHNVEILSIDLRHNYRGEGKIVTVLREDGLCEEVMSKYLKKCAKEIRK